MTLKEQCEFILNLEEGEEFEIGNRSNNPFRFENGMIIDKNGVIFSMEGEDFRKLPWEPKKGGLYFFPSFSQRHSYNCFIRSERGHNDDKEYERIKRTVGIFKTREEAIEEARKLGWLD